MQYILTFSSEEIGNECVGFFLEDREKKRYSCLERRNDKCGYDFYRAFERDRDTRPNRRGNFCEKIQRKLVPLPRRMEIGEQ